MSYSGVGLGATLETELVMTAFGQRAACGFPEGQILGFAGLTKEYKR